MSNVILTGKISLGLQFIVGIMDSFVLTLPRSKNILLRDLIKLELFVQIIEFIFYFWMVRSWGKYKISTITQIRYYDWAFTTPAMLITLMAFLGGSENQTLFSFIQEHSQFIAKIIFLNLSMLLFGLAGERKYLSQKKSVVLGFIPFIIYYTMIYQKFIHNKNLPKIKIYLFMYYFITWSVYGIVALLPDVPKNIGYNILDLFSKNILGVLLSILLFLQPPS
jgi:bacteriorhodopsin